MAALWRLLPKHGKICGVGGGARGQSLRMQSRWHSGPARLLGAHAPNAQKKGRVLGSKSGSEKICEPTPRLPSRTGFTPTCPGPAISSDGSARGSLPSHRTHHVPRGTMFDLCIGNIFCQFALHFHNYVF